ncbi:hypothetical protein MARPU_06250 [Marichromatium purpuratum 984]|uniref:Uncharacterized protein n=1 Tax=Marichromatium purpuratum 984 TaxID=765910 RepID=W0E7E2_MARPU|nr:hypothetical protein MARPU_06250 [Marichromatium purpuratum 984]
MATRDFERVLTAFDGFLAAAAKVIDETAKPLPCAIG